MSEQVNKQSGDGLLFPLVQQAMVTVFASMILDGGVIATFVLYASAAYWAGYVVVRIRRGGNLTAADKILIRWGYLILCAVSPFITSLVWNLQK